MIEVSEIAVEEFRKYFEGKDMSPVRIYGRPG